MIDFSRINSLSNGQRYAFEEMVCRLAHLDPPSKRASFRRIEGSGGDSGVECYWVDPIGAKIGYQAKYFLRAGDIDWQQIDHSVVTALTSHPTLIKYVIAIPCDLTERSGKHGKGKGGWDHWDTHKARWEFLARKRFKKSVEFIPWTRFEIAARLAESSGTGLRALFFGEPELSPDWFKRRLDLSIAALDERYHPDDHVDVSIQTLFQFLRRESGARRSIAEKLNGLRATISTVSQLRKLRPGPPKKNLPKLMQALKELAACEAELEAPPWEQWELEKWTHLAESCGQIAAVLQRWVWDIKATLPQDQAARLKFESAYSTLTRLSSEIAQLTSIFRQKRLVAERERVALVEGHAGVGKSHLLARIAEAMAAERCPVILLLGQQFNNQPVWPQILERLELSHVSADNFLGALNAAAESVGSRALILIDAINEGAGASLWRRELAAFLAQIKSYANIACVVTCRSEYVQFAIPSELLGTIPRFEVRGFETLEEQDSAARTYMDRRGISRPATPWLAPEFVNPLFLRSCCIALAREGKKEFPRGLTGTKRIFAFFLDSAARHLGVGLDGGDEFIGPTKRTLLGLAGSMAANRRDFAFKETAFQIANAEFALHAPPLGTSWLEVLRRAGLIRFDPDPEAPSADHLDVPRDVVRFSFQRLQDHLMAEALLESATDIKAAVRENGVLSFMFDGEGVAWKWRGLATALSIQIPERYGVEFMDVLPGPNERWEGAWYIFDAFAESLRWRDPRAFLGRTFDIFNGPARAHIDRLSLIIEFTASIDHPWNAELLHNNLQRRGMADRDASWTYEISNADEAERHPIFRLIDWCLNAQTDAVPRQTQWLCSLCLAWTFTSTNRPLRDKATKALTSLLLVREDLFSDILRAFSAVDDLYVWERILAAAYGACCIDPDPKRLRTFAIVVNETVFSSVPPPEDLLLRDYARGIVELAFAQKVLPNDFNLMKCRPPYGSKMPRLVVTKAQLERLAARCGGSEILRSCTGQLADFGNYEIAPAIGHFARVRITDPDPLTPRQKFSRFESEIIEKVPARAAALARLRNASAALWTSQLMAKRKDRRPLSRNAFLAGRNEVAKAERKLLALLNASERRRYQNEVLPSLSFGQGSKETEARTIDSQAAARWVAKRAYDMGWTKKLFPKELHTVGDYGRSRPIVERIGKKYQWIALSELLCKLADTYWIYSHGEKNIRYDNPTDVGFSRDIDPTVLPMRDTHSSAQGPRDPWVLGPAIELNRVTKNELLKWPFATDPGASFRKLVTRCDQKGREWLALYDYYNVSASLEGSLDTPQSMRQEEFRFVYSIVIRKEQRRSLIAHFKHKHAVDVHHWAPREFTDGPFLLEAPWRGTWDRAQWQDVSAPLPKGLSVSFPVFEYHWESHLDASLPRGARAYLPAPWLMNALGLLPIRYDSSSYSDRSDVCQFLGSQLPPNGASALVDAITLRSYLGRTGLECVWLLISERNAWLGRDMRSGAWRRSEGICWMQGNGLKAFTWNRDTRRLAE